MSLLVLTIAIGKAYAALAKLTHPSIKAYAKRIGATFRCITQQTTATTTPHWEKFQIAALLKRYDRVLYLDTDLIIRDDCPSLFDLVPDDQLGMFNEAQFTERSKEMMIEVCKAYGVQLAHWDGRYFNSGVIVISRGHEVLLRKPDKEVFNFYEQSYLNMMIAALQPAMFELPYQYNRMTCMDSVTGERRQASYIVHYAGCPNPSILPPLIREDLDYWKSCAGQYTFQRHIHIQVTGGLGDQVNAEPALRFMRQEVYPYDALDISTNHPELFKHLRALAIGVHAHGKFVPEPDIPYYTLNSLPSHETLTWGIISNLLCHTVDYCSIALLRRILPVECKRIYLSVEVDARAQLRALAPGIRFDDLVLMHAGRHWETKTFPLPWWQAVVDGLVATGHHVCLIGRNDETPADTRGYVPVVCPPTALDLRDKLSLDQLIALIELAPVLLSNDSAPVHLAGAFDNWVVLIPSCKHPEHVLPIRYGTTTYKTRALYRKLTLDDVSSQPTEVHGSSADFVVHNWHEYLEEPGKIVSTISLLLLSQED